MSLSLQLWWWISILNQYQNLGSRRISSPLKILIILYFTWLDMTMKQPFLDLDLVYIQGYESFYLKLFTIWNAIWSCCLAWCLRTCTTLWMNQKISRILFLLQTQAVEGTLRFLYSKSFSLRISPIIFLISLFTSIILKKQLHMINVIPQFSILWYRTEYRTTLASTELD